MALVRDWLPGFLGRHRARFGPHDWPTEGSEEYSEFSRVWLISLSTGEVSESEADAASFRLGADPPRFRNEHIVKLIDQVKAIRAERGSLAGTREEVERQSKGCERCGGSGMTSVFHPTPDHLRRIPESVAAHCICPHGRWIRKRLSAAEETRDLLRRIPDLEDVQAGRSDWLLEPPAFLEFMRGVGDGPRFVQDASGSRLVRVNVRSIGRSV